jgi:hypothetical protein
MGDRRRDVSVADFGGRARARVSGRFRAGGVGREVAGAGKVTARRCADEGVRCTRAWFDHRQDAQRAPTLSDPDIRVSPVGLVRAQFPACRTKGRGGVIKRESISGKELAKNGWRFQTSGLTLQVVSVVMTVAFVRTVNQPASRRDSGRVPARRHAQANDSLWNFIDCECLCLDEATRQPYQQSAPENAS